MNSSKDIFKNFLGTWVIKRVLGSFGNAEGIAKFSLQDLTLESDTPNAQSPTKNGSDKLEILHYREDVEVNYNKNFIAGQATTQNAYKEYLYMYDESRDKIIKKFMDGRLFYELSVDFEKREADGDHLCEKDFYRAKYSFRDPDHFSLKYDVRGPEKEYVIETQFIKMIKNP